MFQRNFTQLAPLSKRAIGGFGFSTKSNSTSEAMRKFERYIVLEPDYKENRFQLGRVAPQIKPLYSQTVMKLIAKSFSKPDLEAVSDTYIPPKVHENSVFVFESPQLGNVSRFARSTEYMFVFFLLTQASFPLFSVAVGMFGYVGFANAFFYEMSRRLVVRMDLLPHQHALNIQKVGAFGTLYNKIIRIEDLEHVNLEQIEDNENYFWRFNYKIFDHNLIFRNRVTKELYLFDRKGIWNKKGLEHELLV